MLNNQTNSSIVVVKIVASAVAIVVGAELLFGNMFSWSNNDYWGHLYAFLSALAMWVGVGALMVDSIKNIAKILLVTHAASTVVTWILSGQELGVAVFLVGIDLALFSLNLRPKKAIR